MNEWRELPVRFVDKIGDFAIWSGARLVVVTPLAIIRLVEWTAGRVQALAKMFGDSYEKIIPIYDALPLGAIHTPRYIETTAKIVTNYLIEPITDIFAEIEGKQLMILGEMGSGKSTVAQYFAYTVGGKVKVYECEGTPEDWQGLEVVGEGENWDAINESMAEDLEDLSNQLKVRKEKGDAALSGSEKVIIVEEFPELVNKCDNSGEWLDRHARRGRKARRFAILLSQYDRVAAWGMEGKSDLLDAFKRLRLGKKAVNHAKGLKRDDLVEWLRGDRCRAMLDDDPVILPSYREMKSVTQRLSILPGLVPVTVIEPARTELPTDPEIALWRSISAHLAAGRGESWIVKEILGYQGAQYNRGKEILADLKAKFL